MDSSMCPRRYRLQIWVSVFHQDNSSGAMFLDRRRPVPFVNDRLGQRLDRQTGQSQPLLNHELGSPVVCRGCPNRSEVISTCSTCADYSQWPTSCIADRSSGNAIGPLQRLDVVARPQTTLSKASVACSLPPRARVLVDTPL